MVARATTHWFVLDLATRKPVRPADVLDPRFPREAPPPGVALSPGKLPELRARLVGGLEELEEPSNLRDDEAVCVDSGVPSLEDEPRRAQATEYVHDLRNG